MGFELTHRMRPKEVLEAERRLLLQVPPSPFRYTDLVPDDPFLTAIDVLAQVEAVLGTSLDVTWSGMERLVDGMTQYDMLADVAPIPPPDLLHLGWHGQCAYEALYDDDLPAAARAAIEGWLAQEPPMRGIATFKLTCNDGWTVSPRECETALAILGDRTAPPGVNPGFWADWIRFVRTAVDRGGFRVT